MMKRLLLASLAVVCVGLALATAQTINRSVQLSFDSNGLVGFSTQNAMFLPGKLHGNNQRTPAVTSAGTGAVITGTDMAGEVVEGTGAVTAPNVTFAQAYPATPYCTATSNSHLTPIGLFSTPNGFNATHLSNTSTILRWYYICIGARV